MRLSKIKLAGFKSFVDPTTIPMPSNLIGIVGPNGCGKSNVIDAVRWVMGETSAKHLRGDSMADVIFNGSNTRKPVGQASIELVFDNSDGSLGGEYAKYSEISIKRVVSRDGTSNYFQNGTRCRRKDITDIFLGTGLGPRSYSIIEQGMISRLIEAKPEELRIFLEEAAGISKYKERRRETENRIRHTRENMERLSDLREELGKQLAHLQRQSKTAEKFKELKQQERLQKAQLTTLRWHDLDEQIKLKDSKIRDTETAYEGEVARQRKLEAEIEKLREQHSEASEAFNQVQGHFYSVGSEISKIEQNIQHAKEMCAQYQKDLKEAEMSVVETQVHITSDQNRLGELTRALQQYQPDYAVAKEKEQASAAQLESVEQRMQQWQGQWEQFNAESAEPSRLADIERTRIEHLEQQVLQMHQRGEKLERELDQISPAQAEIELGQLQEQREILTQQVEQYQEKQDALKLTLAELSEKIEQLDLSISDKRREVEDCTGRLAALEALQQDALGKQDSAPSQWLAARQLDRNSRLAETMEVDSGWEAAVESVLDNWLDAVCVNRVSDYLRDFRSLNEGSVTFLQQQGQIATAPSSSLPLTRLRDKIRRGAEALAMIDGIYCVDELDQAENFIGALGDNESIITRRGEWISKHWARVARSKDQQAGILQREQLIKQLQQQRALLEQAIAELESRRDDNKQRRAEMQIEFEDAQREAQSQHRQMADVSAKCNAKSERLQQMKSRQAEIHKELEDLRVQRGENESQAQQCRGRLQDAIQNMEIMVAKREELQQQREQLQGQLQEVRHNARHDREKANELNIRINTINTEVISLTQNQERMRHQIEKMTQRRDELQSMIVDAEAPIAGFSEQLSGLLAKRVEAENKLSESRRMVESLDHDIRSFNSERHEVEQKSAVIRGDLDQMRLDWQESNVRRKTLEEALAQTDYQLETLFKELPEGANIEEWEQLLDKTTQRIQKLGPINLAAIEEYQQQSERKNFLDAQNDDLQEALETLENAIRKIDKETRNRFRETYDRVNNGFKTMFPRLFGGGQAYLELTGDDLLDTGITVMARPPGKRNSTIHLLSGGEKALTAVALVFSIFQLNPAPFCMLDEVDAPLDDANVGRFCSMVEEMSEHVQFIFITHNKITMELAQQLNGVTMHEPGVSRIVAVDVNEAVELAS